jgi:hypothetical protein
MKVAVYRNVVPCSQSDTDRDVSKKLTTTIIKATALMTEAVNSSETSVHIYHTTRCNIPEDSRIQI